MLLNKQYFIEDKVLQDVPFAAGKSLNGTPSYKKIKEKENEKARKQMYAYHLCRFYG